MTNYRCGCASAFAASDLLAVVNNMSDFVFSIIKALVMILLGFGIVQIGMSLKSHDASLRAASFMTIFGDLFIAFTKEILDLIMVQYNRCIVSTLDA